MQSRVRNASRSQITASQLADLSQQVGIEHGYDESYDQRHLPRGEEGRLLVNLLHVPAAGLVGDLNAILVDYLTQNVFLHQFFGIETVPDVLEVFRRVFPGLVDEHLVSARMFVQELRHVVYYIVYNEDGPVFRVPFGDLLSGELFSGHVCVRVLIASSDEND